MNTKKGETAPLKREREREKKRREETMLIRFSRTANANFLEMIISIVIVFEVNMRWSRVLTEIVIDMVPMFRAYPV